MIKEKQIEEMAKVLGSDCGDCQECEYYRVRVKEGINVCYFKYAEMLYNAGYRKQSEDALKGEWISVEERMPEKEGKYLVCTTKGNIGVGNFIDYYGTGTHLCFDGWAVSHWMPLPEQPKGE